MEPRYFPASSAVPQPTAPPRIPSYQKHSTFTFELLTVKKMQEEERKGL
jgi:hypothetical protein